MNLKLRYSFLKGIFFCQYLTPKYPGDNHKEIACVTQQDTS